MDQIQNAMEGNIDAANIKDFINVLTEHRNQCEASGKYVEAEMASNRIAELK